MKLLAVYIILYSQSLDALDDAPWNVVEGPIGTIHFAAPVPALALFGTRYLAVPSGPASPASAAAAAAAAAAAQRPPVAGPAGGLAQGQEGHTQQHQCQATPRAEAGSGVVVVVVVVVVAVGRSGYISGIPSRRHRLWFFLRW